MKTLTNTPSSLTTFNQKILVSENTHQFWWVIFTQQLSHQFYFSLLSHMITAHFFHSSPIFFSHVPSLSHDDILISWTWRFFFLWHKLCGSFIYLFFLSFFLEFGWEANENFCEFLSNDLISRWRCLVAYYIKRLNRGRINKSKKTSFKWNSDSEQLK